MIPVSREGEPWAGYLLRGATQSLRIDRERQQRCMELGITPAQLADLEAAEAVASAP